jgi:hypothetical protein
MDNFQKNFNWDADFGLETSDPNKKDNSLIKPETIFQENNDLPSD